MVSGAVHIAAVNKLQVVEDGYQFFQKRQARCAHTYTKSTTLGLTTITNYL